jgi:DNA invertase Pin-like site-specific DNA recombinase
MRGTQTWPQAGAQAGAQEPAAGQPAPRLVGYGRVSTRDQQPGMQVDALRAAGCERIYADKGVSGKLASRPELDKCLAALQAGDVLTVWKLDRLGRSVQHLVQVINDLRERGIGFRSLTEALDTTTNGGMLIFHIFAAIAEFERGLIIERTMAGLDAARAKGHKGGRRPSLTREQKQMAAQMLDVPQPNVAAVARTLGVSRATVYRAIGEQRES